MRSAHILKTRKPVQTHIHFYRRGLQRMSVHVGPAKEKWCHCNLDWDTKKTPAFPVPTLMITHRNGRTLMGALEGRKEAASLLILGTLHLRWNAGKAERRRGEVGKFCLSLSRLSASCLSNYHYPLHPLWESLIALWFSESFLALFLFPALPPSLPLPGFLCLFLLFSDSLFHSHLPPLLSVPE